MLQLYRNQGRNDHRNIAEAQGTIMPLAIGPQQSKQRQEE